MSILSAAASRAFAAFAGGLLTAAASAASAQSLTPRLSAKGEAYWPGKSIMPANEGEFSGTATPSGRRLHFAADPCLVNLILAGEFLFVDDNRMCGGHNASFSGIFIRRPERPR